MTSSKPLSADALKAAYRQRHAVLQVIAIQLEELVSEYLRGEPRIDRITTRAKEIDSFVEKALKMENKKRKYPDPLSQIQDQVGARIITFYRADVERLDEIVLRYFTPIESKDRVPDSEWEFGYFGRHHVLLLPSDVTPEDPNSDLVPRFFELQIKTLFQHAWSESEHDLGYKAGESPLTSDQKRKLAFTSAQAWGADHIFDELFCERTTPKLSR
jgi:putative GTP pyrophosphokinase